MNEELPGAATVATVHPGSKDSAKDSQSTNSLGLKKRTFCEEGQDICAEIIMFYNIQEQLHADGEISG